MTLNTLKSRVMQTGSKFFDRSTMKFFGDTMRNYKVSGPVSVSTYSGPRTVWELERKRPVKEGYSGSAYFDVETYERVHPCK